jgi:UrcA family protein
MNTSTSKTISVILIAATVVVATSATQADPLTATFLNLAPESRQVFVEPSITIKLGDVNTATPDGARIVYGRIQSAARAVCASSIRRVPGAKWEWKLCYEATVNRAVVQLNRPAVTALHRHEAAI